MRRFLIAGLVGIGLIAAACSPTADEPTPDATDYTLYLVRHAEKQGGDDPALTTEGGQRAVDLADRLEEAGIEKIWSSDFRRTRATAEPLAKRLGLDVVIYDANDLASLAEGLKSDGVTALVVGHSNTTPELSDLLGGEAGSPIDEAAEYDRLYVLNGVGSETVDTQIERYGVAFGG